MRFVVWNKSLFDWYAFLSFDLSVIMDFGVYVIWHDGNPGRVVHVGQGDVRTRLASHREDNSITQYSKHGTLRVTWAAIPASQVDGVERYLADLLHPLVEDAHPSAAPVAVNW